MSIRSTRRALTAAWSALILAASGSAWAASAAPGPTTATPPPSDASGSVQVLPVVPGIVMLTVDGLNIAVQTGPDGTVVVNPGPAKDAQAVIAAIRRVTDEPIRYLIDTGADEELVGGNAALAVAGRGIAQQDLFIAGQQRTFSELVKVPGANGGRGAPIIARQNVLMEMVASPQVSGSGAALPTDVFTRPQFNFFANEPIAVVRLPAAHSDADAAVRFERSDVVVAGEIFDPTHFPVIDPRNGGSIHGEIAALDQVMNTLVFAHTPVLANTGGTLVIPVRGPLSDLNDLVSYRDMVATVAARIQFYIDRGRSYSQIIAADPAQGYHTRYGTDAGSWTTADFIRAAYESLMAERKAHYDGRG
jgi:glyoxylase-like metal-dependent hydrolase (beta-lactamase superfamily II)